MAPPEDSSAPAAPARAVAIGAEPLLPARPFARALLVANPIAGRGRGERIARDLAEALGSRGVRAEVHLTGRRGDARARVRCLEDGTDLVVSVGGDGTLREVFDGLVDPLVPVGVLPLGTANVLALDLGLPRDVDGAVEVMLGRRVQKVDVATVNGHLSFLVTGVGLDALAVREVERVRRGPITKRTYVRAVLAALRGYQPPRLAVEIDGEPLEGSFGLVLVSNIVHYGGILRLSAARRLDDGRYEVYLFRDAGVARLAAAALVGAVAGLPRRTLCEMRTARRVVITSPEPVPCHVDGDFRGTTPVEVVVTPRQVRVLVPHLPR